MTFASKSFFGPSYASNEAYTAYATHLGYYVKVSSDRKSPIKKDIWDMKMVGDN